MLVVIGIMLGGFIVGYLFRHASWKGLPALITLFIWILLFLLGNEIGRDEQVVRSFHSLGMEAAVLTFAAVTGLFSSSRITILTSTSPPAGTECRETWKKLLTLSTPARAQPVRQTANADRNILLFFMSRHSNPQLIRW